MAVLSASGSGSMHMKRSSDSLLRSPKRSRNRQRSSRIALRPNAPTPMISVGRNAPVSGWAMVGQELLIDDRQAVLIAVFGNLADKRLRRGVQRRHAPHEARRTLPLEVFDQPEVGHLDVVADDEQVFRFDVQMLEAMRLVVH